MALNLTLYKFSKKKNSTARPSGGDLFPVELKEQTEVLNPTILLKISNYPDYNYAFIEEFDRYYFVTAITWNVGLWNISLEVDPLASWKQTIGGHTLFVTRCSRSSSGDDIFNTLLKDLVYPTQKDPVQVVTQPLTGGSPWLIDDISDGTFVVGIIGTQVTYYAFTYIQWGAFLINLFSDTYLNDIVPDWATTFQDLKARANPLQFISSVMWFPLDDSDFGQSTVQSIPVGYGSISAVVSKLSGTQVISKSRTFDISDHPQAGIRGQYLNSAPYTDYNLFYPPFGKFNLNPDIMSESAGDLLVVDIDIDVRTGEGTLTARAGDTLANILVWANAKVGVNYQVSQVMNSGMGISQIAQTGGALVAGAVLGGPAGLAGSAIAGGASGIGDYLAGKIPSASVVGSQSGVNALQGTPTLFVEHYKLVDEDLENRGRPFCTLRQINTLRGYMVVEPANVSIPAQSSELDSIKQYMEGGFYYE